MSFLEQVKLDPRVADAWSEGGRDGDGYWIDLKSGFRCGESETHAVHEWTLTDLRRSFKTVEPCTCKDCGREGKAVQS